MWGLPWLPVKRRVRVLSSESCADRPQGEAAAEGKEMRGLTIQFIVRVSVSRIDPILNDGIALVLSF